MPLKLRQQQNSKPSSQISVQDIKANNDISFFDMTVRDLKLASQNNSTDKDSLLNSIRDNEKQQDAKLPLGLQT